MAEGVRVNVLFYLALFGVFLEYLPYHVPG